MLANWCRLSFIRVNLDSWAYMVPKAHHRQEFVFFFLLSQVWGRVSIVRLLATDGYPQTGKGMCNPHPHHHRILLSSTQSVVNGTANKRKDLIA